MSVKTNMAEKNRYEISILAKLWRRNLFGGKYEPLEKLMSDIPAERRDRAREAFEKLKQDQLIRLHKNGKCASINTNQKQNVRDILEGEIPDHILELR